jgi:hypothetical protein
VPVLRPKDENIQIYKIYKYTNIKYIALVYGASFPNNFRKYNKQLLNKFSITHTKNEEMGKIVSLKNRFQEVH